MTGQHLVKLVGIKHPGFDKLQDAGEVLGAAELERKGDQMLTPEITRPEAFSTSGSLFRNNRHQSVVR